MEELVPVEFRASCNTEAQTFIANITENCKRRLPRLGMKRAIVCGGGPSLVDHLDEIKKLQKQGADVFAINGAVGFLSDHGIIPEYGILYDARPQNEQFIPGYPYRRTHWLVASHANPEVFIKLADQGMDVTMFHSAGAEGVVEVITELERKAYVMSGTITGGLQALNLLLVMGHRQARLYGYDSSTRSTFDDGSVNYEKHAYAQPLNADQKLIDIHFDEKYYMTTGVMANQAQTFMKAYPFYEGKGIEIEVIGEGLLPDMWRFQKRPIEGDTEEEREANKYVHMWENPEYRRYSPGEGLVEYFISLANPKDGSRIYDFGCGPGRATQRFKDLGFDVIGIDHAPNCLDDGVHVPFCLANLWQLPENLKACSWGYCCDVMEHIPEHRIDGVLHGIWKVSFRGAFFRIADCPDSFGDEKTGPLHLTVKPFEWWEQRLSEHFRSVENHGSGTFVCIK